MTAAIIADNKPIALELEADKKYYWCACGRSSKQPLCDASHKDTGFSPLGFSVEESKKAYLCQCKQTSTPPYCDGTHKKFTDADVGQAAK